MVTAELEEIEDKERLLSSEEKIHPWRLCSTGKHFVKKHIVHMPPSTEHPNGQIIERHEHCALNPSKKDILSFDEIQEITVKHFQRLNGGPKAGTLQGYTNADKFDVEIRGWTHYWNDIFSFPEPLDANLVKALMASESSFHPNTDIPAGKGQGRARGLMQVTDGTMHILSDHHGELSNYLICFDHSKLLDPSANICAGIRWLFRKKVIADSKLGRKSTWIEAVAEYKGVLKKTPPPAVIERFLHLYFCTTNGCSL